jgi:hypothetical protein
MKTSSDLRLFSFLFVHSSISISGGEQSSDAGDDVTSYSDTSKKWPLSSTSEN